MGNCSSSPTKSTAEIAPHEFIKPSSATASRAATKTTATTAATTTVEIHARPNSTFALYFRHALHLKSVPFHVVPSPENSLLLSGEGGAASSGSRESLLRLLDDRFPEPRLVPGDGSLYRKEGSLMVLLLEGETAPLVVRLVALQHRSVTWHLARLVRWVEDLRTRGGKKKGGGGKVTVVNPAVGNARMEVKKFGESYNGLLEVLMEHAQMEERVVFPILEAADRGLCQTANEEHGRHFPIMNGIKEVIKSVLVLEAGSPDYLEALSDLLIRLKTLEKRCKDHFDEEQRDILPLMEAVDLSKEQQQEVVDRCLDLMQATHSRLFSFLIEGLLPWEAMLYLDLIIRCKEEDQAVWMIRRIID